jgi:hypothetical protein
MRDTDAVGLFPDATNTPADDELTAYLGGKHKILLANADQCLKWWKVSYLELYDFQSFLQIKKTNYFLTQ